MNRRLLIALATLVIGAVGAARGGAQDGGAIRFSVMDTGLDFVHVSGKTPQRRLPETMGAGAAWTDFDVDGDQDLYLVQSGWLPGTLPAGTTQPANALYRNDGHGGYRVVRTGSEDDGYGMGVALADYDNDGWPDLYVTNFASNALYRNNGDGTFSRQSGAGVDEARWSSSAAWGDLDSDGDADLFVVNYVPFDVANAPVCGEGIDATAYCHIDLFDGLGDTLYRNNGDGTFTDVAVSAGVVNPADGKGLGVVIGNLDGDFRPDIFVANDTQQNFFYVNLGELRFDEQGLFSGTGYSGEGEAQSGMGTDMVDLDGDGSNEVLVTNFAFQNNNLYRQFAPGAYLDESYVLGFGQPGLGPLSFGIVGFDADLDGDREIAVANGHILDNVEAVQDGLTYRQPNHLFRNLLAEQRVARRSSGDPVEAGQWRPSSALFELVGGDDGFALAEVTRGLAVGDADGDGRPDVLFTNCGGPAHLLQNDGAGGGRLVLRLRGRASNRDALGARVKVTPSGAAVNDGAAGFAQWAEVRAGASYASQNATDLYFGLGANDVVAVEVTWPDGASESYPPMPGNRIALIQQGKQPVLRPLRE